MAAAAPSQQVIRKYQELMQECQQLQAKITDLESQHHEHKVVEEILQPLNPDRRAFRLVGGVLVERTVKEVLPTVSTNRENLEQILTQLRNRLQSKQKETAEHKAKYNLTETTE